jgi:hypothetical protein
MDGFLYEFEGVGHFTSQVPRCLCFFLFELAAGAQLLD